MVNLIYFKLHFFKQIIFSFYCLIDLLKNHLLAMILVWDFFLPKLLLLTLFRLFFSTVFFFASFVIFGSILALIYFYLISILVKQFWMEFIWCYSTEIYTVFLQIYRDSSFLLLLKSLDFFLYFWIFCDGFMVRFS